MLTKEDNFVSETAPDFFRGLLARGELYLSKNAGHHNSTYIECLENFSQLLILQSTGNRKLMKLPPRPRRTWNFYLNQQDEVPDDFDTTALAWTILRGCTETAHSVLNDILALNHNGIITTYFDSSRPRTDPVVCLNVLHFAYSYDYPSKDRLASTEQYVSSVLQNRTYLSGTRYYPSPDGFLFFFSRLLSCNQASEFRTAILPLLQERILERLGEPSDAVGLAMRILAAQGADCAVTGELELELEREIVRLCTFQLEDGGWDAGKLFRFGTSGVEFGNRGVSTALAVEAITEYTRVF